MLLRESLIINLPGLEDSLNLCHIFLLNSYLVMPIPFLDLFSFTKQYFNSAYQAPGLHSENLIEQRWEHQMETRVFDPSLEKQTKYRIIS